MLNQTCKFDPDPSRQRMEPLFISGGNCCGKIGTWSRKLLNSLDITRQVNERRLLNFVFRSHVAYLALFFVLPYLEGNVVYTYRSLSAEEKEDPGVSWKMRINFWIILLSGIAGIKCVVLLGLARRPKQTQSKMRFYLKVYKIYNLVGVPPSFALILVLKLWINAPPKWTFDAILSVVLLCTLIISKLYLISVVIRIYHKLGSQAIDRLIEHKGKEDSETGSGSPFVNFVDIPSGIDKNFGQNKEQVKEQRQIEIKNCDSARQVSNESTSDKVGISDRLFHDKIISPLNISIDTSKFIGEGQFGTVFTGTLRRNCSCHPKIGIAAKIVKNCEKGDTLQMLLQEIKIAILAGDHPNIVLFYGISSDASLNAQCAIITEFCEMGSLEMFLKNNRHTFVNLLREQGNIIYKDQKLYINLDMHGTHTSLDLMRFAHQIAVGMDHLSSRRIIHGDLACRNVLLTKDLTVKLCDFGMSRRLYGYQLYLNGAQNEEEAEKCLPWRWMSYEAIKDFKFSTKSDVWSFGVVLYEIFTLGGFPFKELTWSPDILQKIENGMRLERPAFAPEEIYEVMQCCWSLNPSKRPPFKELRNILTKVNAQQSKSLQLFQ